MSGFYLEAGEIQFGRGDGPLEPQEAIALLLMDIRQSMRVIEESCEGISHILTNGEVKVHRTHP